tara:strand:- start:1267 stop:1995 length:729 start_codon:yes stop_codon:yes gene_type:complete
MNELFIPQVSSYAGDIDFLVDLITYLVGFWFIVSEVALFYFLFRFRRKSDCSTTYIDGTDKKHKRWINVPHLIIIACDVVLIIGATKVWYHVKQDLPEDPDATIGIISQQWAWTFVHPGKDGELHTDDDVALVDELHLEKDKTYNYELTSKDVLHSFSVPVFRLKQDAVPGRLIRGWFRPEMTGEFDIQCAEMCGIGHGVMGARLIVDTSEKHQKWLAEVSRKSPGNLGLAAVPSKPNSPKK